MPPIQLKRLAGRRVHIAGSASRDRPFELVRYAHELVRDVTRGILRSAGGVVLGVVPEPRMSDSQNAPGLLFDWTAMEAALECLRADEVTFPASAGNPIVLVCSAVGESRIPEERRGLWESLLASDAVQVERIRAGLRAGSLIRERQIDFSDALLVIGGGAGAEHAADLYLERERTVVPFDLALGASRGDGTGGGARLYDEARANAQAFLRLDQTRETLAGTRLAQIATRGGTVNVKEIAETTVALLNEIERPRAFYVRLLNDQHERFQVVEAFFRDVVDPLVDKAEYRRVEVGTDRAEEAFINVEIFRHLYYAALVIVDITGMRPNCFIELGYALGRGTRVLLTAEHGTQLPFDQQAIPCFFWRADEPNEERRRQFGIFWRRVIDRGPVVP